MKKKFFTVLFVGCMNAIVFTGCSSSSDNASIKKMEVINIVKNEEVHDKTGEPMCYLEADSGIAVAEIGNYGFYKPYDYSGEEIISVDKESYIGYKISDEGMIVLGDLFGSVMKVYDSEGNLVSEVQDCPFDYEYVVQLNENNVLYSDYFKLVAHDVTTNETWFETEDVSFGASEFSDGAFYYASEEKIYKVSRDGTVEEVADEAGFSFTTAFSKGYNLMPQYSYRVAFLNKETNEVLKFDLKELGELYLGQDYPYWIDAAPVSYYDNGLTKQNNGTQFVLTYWNGNEQRYCLVDIAGAKADENGELELSEDMFLAEHSYIGLSECGYYLAREGNRTFYMDETGRAIETGYIDGSAFYKGYAAVVDEDGLAYIVDCNFEKVTEGYPADKVYTAGGSFVIEKDGIQTVFGLRELPGENETEYISYNVAKWPTMEDITQLPSAGNRYTQPMADGENGVIEIERYYAAPEYVGGDAGIVICNDTGTVIKALNYDAQYIVSEYHGGYKLSNDGQVAMGTSAIRSSIWYVYDMEGNLLAEFNDSKLDNIVNDVHINDNCVTYATGSKVIACDLSTGETWFEEVGRWTGVTEFSDGEFYYSIDGKIYKMTRDGHTEQVAYAENLRFNSAFSKGYASMVPKSSVNTVALYNKDTNEVLKIDLDELARAYLGDGYEYVGYINSLYYYDNGLDKQNNGTQFVWKYIRNNKERHCLVDIAGAPVDGNGMVEISEDLILADCEYIALSDCGYYLAGEDDRWFYIDETGKEVSQSYVDCSSFYGGYAVVVEDDGMAYMINSDFERVSKGYPADRVYTAKGIFAIQNGYEKTYLAPPVN